MRIKGRILISITRLQKSPVARGKGGTAVKMSHENTRKNVLDFNKVGST